MAPCLPRSSAGTRRNKRGINRWMSSF
jgi:hypothetical protein